MQFFQNLSDSQFLSRQIQQIASTFLLGGFTMVFLWSVDICAQILFGQTENRLTTLTLFSVYAVSCAVYMGYLALIVFEEHQKRVIRDIKMNLTSKTIESTRKPGVLFHPDFKSAKRTKLSSTSDLQGNRPKLTLAA
jgi:hypothetical protein